MKERELHWKNDLEKQKHVLSCYFLVPFEQVCTFGRHVPMDVITVIDIKITDFNTIRRYEVVEVFSNFLARTLQPKILSTYTQFGGFLQFDQKGQLDAVT